ncbi:hypothetical protein ACTGZQ_00800 [Streptococcus suis]
MKLSKWQLIIAVILVIGGIVIFHQYQQRQEELKRNREYEVSLVKALKNSYEGIEEINITEPNYSMPPGSWSCDVEIIFKDGEEVTYRIGHSLDATYNYQGSKQSDAEWTYLEEHKGLTVDRVKVKYSNGVEGEQ